MNPLSLPLELLQRIATYVETAHRPSLYAFSLTSKVCHQASLFTVFRQISITAKDGQGLKRDVDALIKALSRTNSSRHIRQITIKGDLRSSTKKLEGHGPQTPWSVTTGLDDILHEEPISWTGMYSVYDEAVIERSSNEDLAWAPVVNLLQIGILLKDLIYDCQSQFPPSLLQVLHERHPQCRLHHLAFRFRTLLWDVPVPYEMELATSPSLYRVKVICAQRDSDGDDDFNLEAMLELTSSLAPNLKEVTILNLFPGGSARGRRPRDSWRGLPGYTSEKRGSLTSLSLKGFSRLRDPAALQGWARHINFACLQHLTLGGCSEAKSSGLSGEAMEWVSQTQSFPRVKTLSVYLYRDDTFEDKPHYSEHASSFFKAFESLEELSIYGPIESIIMDTVLSHHGQTLRKLVLHPFEQVLRQPRGRDMEQIPFQFTKDEILQVEAHCPVLEELSIPIKRSKSSESEAEMYRYLGKIKSLRSLFLILDCSNWRLGRDPTYDPQFDEEDRKSLNDDRYPYLKRGELKATFINCAVDEALARSIWKIIDQGKIGRRLERLRLWPNGEAEYGNDDHLPETFNAIARNLSRSWLFERVPRDDMEDYTVRELRQDRRKTRNQNDAGYLAYRHDPDIWEVFDSIWPSKESSSDRLHDWWSFPLDMK